MMKDEEKRQAQESNSPAATTPISSSNNPLFDEGGPLTGQTPPSTTRSANNPGTSATSTSSGGSEESAPVVEFFLQDADSFEGDSKYLMKADDTPITVPLKLHPVLTGKSAYEVEKALCHTALRDDPPLCIDLAPTEQETRHQGSQDKDGVNDSMTFSLPLDPELSVPPGSAYFLRVKWSRREQEGNDNGGTAGFSYSAVFGEASANYDNGRFLSDWTAPLSFVEEDSVTGNRVTVSILKGDEFAPAELGREALDEAGRSIDNASGVPSGTTATPTPDPSNDPRGGAGETTDATPSATPSPGGGGGLSSGAIIGIAVAAGIIGLAAIGLLVWFFCLRNRRRRHGTKDHGPYAAPDHQASEYMVNKETTGAHVTESPHSPYSDDGSLAHPQGQGSSLAQVQQQQQTTNQYSDAPPIAAPVPRSAAQQVGDRPGSGSGTRSDTPGGGHNVSHLIEEGMTEADIRRLEEEERALDDAIERAGHGRR